MRIKSVALIGTGAVGAWFIPGLSVMLGRHFYVIASGERAKRLKNEGVCINGRWYDGSSLNIKTPEEAGAEGVDLLLVAVKYGALEDVMYGIRTIVEETSVLPHAERPAAPYGTTVISCLNGVDSEEKTAAVIGEEHVLPAFMRVVSARSGNIINYDPMKPAVLRGLIFGEADTGEKTERCAAVEEVMKNAGIGCAFVPNIKALMWKKFALNIANNLPQAILGVGYGAYIDSSHVRYLHDCLYVETMLVAKKNGIEFEPEENTRSLAAPDSRFSTLQDLDAKRHTEIEMLAGVLMDKAEKAGVNVPFTEYSYHAIKALEEKNDGLFSYPDGKWHDGKISGM